MGNNKTDWNIIDVFLSKYRSNFVKPYLSKYKVFCDIGCGKEGKFIKSIHKYVKKAYGYDFKLLKEEKSKNYILKKSDFTKNNIKYDIISFLAVLEHLDNPDFILKKIYSKLNKNGLLILTTPDKKSKCLLEFLAYKLKVINREEIEDHKTYYTKETLIEKLKTNNFKIIKHKYFQFSLNNLVVCSRD
jgi:2-polyprenyl-3-methyl-5-hydroxy-6-metoxy-1,4-benzoquinol methylase